MESTEPNQPEFIDQKMISDPVPCSLLDSDIQKLKSVFPTGTIFRTCDPNIHADFRSDKWICFPEFPFTLGLKYPFPNIFSDFFDTTGLCYSQTMPMIWRTLFVIQSVNDSHHTHLGIPELAQTYHLRSHGSNYFLFKIKPNRQHLVHCATQNDPKWKERFFFVDRGSLPDDELIPTVWLSKATFEKLAPPLPDTEKLIENFLKVPESDRTFSYLPSPAKFKPQKSISTMSGSQKAASFFSLSDIDDEDTPITETKPIIGSNKGRVPNLRSRSAKKRKTDLTEDLDEPILEFDKAMEQASKCYKEKLDIIDNVQKLASIAAENSSHEIAKLKKEIKDIKAETSSKIAEAQNRINEEREILVTGIKKDATAAVLKARILMVSEASAKGLDTTFWNVQAWQDKLAKLKGEDPKVGDFLDESSGKALKTSVNKTPKTPAQKTTIEIEDLEMNDPDPATEIPKESSAFEEGNTLGKEGK